MISFCVRCKKQVDNEVEQCECSCRTFAFGDLKVEDEKILCRCGSASFNRVSHIDYSDKATTTLTCRECGKICGTEYYRDKDDLMYWEDEEDE